MSVMASRGLLNRDDLDALPDDGLRHELIDGAFVMTPSPGFQHQLMVTALAAQLRDACSGTELVALVGPFDVVLGGNVLVPDILVAERAAFTTRDLRTPPLLIVEVRSPSTQWLDEGRKRSLYEEAGVASYWLVDPVEPAITVLELTAGHYIEVGTVHGHQSLRVNAPVPITLNPAALCTPRPDQGT